MKQGKGPQPNRKEDIMSTTYTTRTEAIAREIAEAIDAGDASSAEYDLEAIADTVLGDFDEGYALKDDVDFWAAVADAHRSLRLRWSTAGAIDADGTFTVALERDDEQDGSFDTEVGAAQLTFDGDVDRFEDADDWTDTEDSLLSRHGLTRSDITEVITLG